MVAAVEFILMEEVDMGRPADRVAMEGVRVIFQFPADPLLQVEATVLEPVQKGTYRLQRHTSM